VGHFEVALEQLDGRQEALRCRPSLYSSPGGTFEVATSVTPRRNRPSNSPPRIMASGDVRYIQLIEAQQARSARQRLRDVLERGALLPDLRQLRVHLVHEAVKVQRRACAKGKVSKNRSISQVLPRPPRPTGTGP